MRRLVRPQGLLRHGGRQVAKGEADEGMVRVERGDDDFADLAIRHRIARAGSHDLDDQVLVDDHDPPGRRSRRR